jgi:putative membrane protein
MPWVETLHIISVVAWFAGLFYLPRLFVYHAMAEDRIGIERFKVMERKLYRGIMTPAMVVLLIMGFWMVYEYAWGAYANQGWLHVKIFLALCLVAYHFYLGHLVKVFARDQNQRSHKFYRIINEVPTLFLFVIVALVVMKPQIF